MICKTCGTNNPADFYRNNMMKRCKRCFTLYNKVRYHQSRVRHYERMLEIITEAKEKEIGNENEREKESSRQV